MVACWQAAETQLDNTPGSPHHQATGPKDEENQDGHEVSFELVKAVTDAVTTALDQVQRHMAAQQDTADHHAPNAAQATAGAESSLEASPEALANSVAEATPMCHNASDPTGATSTKAKPGPKEGRKTAAKAKSGPKEGRKTAAKAKPGPKEGRKTATKAKSGPKEGKSTASSEKSKSGQNANNEDDEVATMKKKLHSVFQKQVAIQ